MSKSSSYIKQMPSQVSCGGYISRIHSLDGLPEHMSCGLRQAWWTRA